MVLGIGTYNLTYNDVTSRISGAAVLAIVTALKRPTHAFCNPTITLVLYHFRLFLIDKQCINEVFMASPRKTRRTSSLRWVHFYPHWIPRSGIVETDVFWNGGYTPTSINYMGPIVRHGRGNSTPHSVWMPCNQIHQGKIVRETTPPTWRGHGGATLENSSVCLRDWATKLGNRGGTMGQA